VVVQAEDAFLPASLGSNVGITARVLQDSSAIPPKEHKHMLRHLRRKGFPSVGEDVELRSATTFQMVDETTRAVNEVVARLSAGGHTPAQIAAMTGLSQDRVGSALSQESSHASAELQRQGLNCVGLHNLSFLAVDAAVVETAMLEITFHSGAHKELARADILLSSVLAAPRMRFPAAGASVFFMGSDGTEFQAHIYISLRGFKPGQHSQRDRRARGGPSPAADAPKQAGGACSPTRTPMNSGMVDHLPHYTPEYDKHWFRILLQKLWPFVQRAIEYFVEVDFPPLLEDKLPHMLKGKVSFTKFALGCRPPDVSDIRVTKRAKMAPTVDGKQVHTEHVDLDFAVGYTSEELMQLWVVVAHVGVQSISIRGVLSVRLCCLQDNLPIVAGIVVGMLDPPSFSYHFTGLSEVLEYEPVAHVVRETIEGAISSLLVVPHVTGFQVAGPETAEALPARFTTHEPLGVLRVSCVRAAGLRAIRHWHLVGRRSSDPLVRLRVGQDEWTSSAVKGTCDPVWTEADTHDFKVYDEQQRLFVDVYDQNTSHKRQRLGWARPLTVAKVLSLVHVPEEMRDCGVLNCREVKFALFDSDTDPHDSAIEEDFMQFSWLKDDFGFAEGAAAGAEEEAAPTDASGGELWLRFEWLELCRGVSGPEGWLVEVVASSVFLPRCCGEAAALHMKIGREKNSTSLVEWQPPPDKDATNMMKALNEIALHLVREGLGSQEIAAVTGLNEYHVEDLIEHGSPELRAKPRPEWIELEFDSRFFFEVTPEQLDSEMLAITVEDQSRKVLGKAELGLRDLASADGLTYEGNSTHAGAPATQFHGDHGVVVFAHIAVSLVGLRPTAS